VVPEEGLFLVRPGAGLGEAEAVGLARDRPGCAAAVLERGDVGAVVGVLLAKDAFLFVRPVVAVVGDVDVLRFVPDSLLGPAALLQFGDVRAVLRVLFAEDGEFVVGPVAATNRWITSMGVAAGAGRGRRGPRQ
jgi:hypothetical protein